MPWEGGGVATFHSTMASFVFNIHTLYNFSSILCNIFFQFFIVKSCIIWMKNCILNENFEKKIKILFNMGEKYSFALITMVPQEIGPIFPKEP